MKVLSIDPGYDRMGVAILAHTKTGEKLLYSDCFMTQARDPFAKRLRAVGEEVIRLIEAYTPDVIALETLYFNANQKTALAVAEVRGVIHFIATVRDIPIDEYTPQQAKIAVTGYGKSDKRHVATMVERLIHPVKRIVYDDEYDAIAIGITCLSNRRQGNT